MQESQAKVACLVPVLEEASKAGAASLCKGPPFCPLIDLDCLEAELPILPTLNGWLLGYPVVYLVTAETALGAAQWLSQEPLCLFSIQVSCTLQVNGEMLC